MHDALIAGIGFSQLKPVDMGQGRTGNPHRRRVGVAPWGVINPAEISRARGWKRTAPRANDGINSPIRIITSRSCWLPRPTSFGVGTSPNCAAPPNGRTFTSTSSSTSSVAMSLAGWWRRARAPNWLCVRSALTKKFAQPGLKVPDSWIYEKTRGRCRYLSGSSALAARRGTGLIPFLHLGRYVRLQRPLPYVCQRNAIPCVSPSVGTFHKG